MNAAEFRTMASQLVRRRRRRRLLNDRKAADEIERLTKRFVQTTLAYVAALESENADLRRQLDYEPAVPPV